MENDIIQSNVKDHLLSDNDNFHGESHLQALNHDGLNTLVLGEKINKNNFPDFNANFQDLSSGIDQYNQQIATFSKQSKMLGLMGDTSDKSKQMDKVTQTLTQSRDKMIQQSEQLAMTIKGTQFFNTVDLEDYALVNNKGLASLSDKEMKQEQIKLFKAAHGTPDGMPSEKELTGEDEEQEQKQPEQEEQEEGE